MAQTVKNLPTIRENQVQSLGWKGPLEKEMTIYSSILAWRIPWTEVVWYSHLFKNFSQFVVIHTVKGFNIVKEAELDVFYGVLFLFP